MVVRVVEVDPICAMQACMDGYEVVSPYKNGKNTGKLEDIDEYLLSRTDLICTCTGNVNVCDANMLQTVKRGAVLVRYLGPSPAQCRRGFDAARELLLELHLGLAKSRPRIWNT